MVTAVDSTGGKHEDAIKATAEKHVGALSHADDVDALDVTLTLTSVKVGATVDCHVRVDVTTASDHASVATHAAARRSRLDPIPTWPPRRPTASTPLSAR